MTFFSPKDAIKGVTSTLREVKKIRQSGITTSEWERFKQILKTQETLVFDSLSSTTALVHNKLVSGINWTDHQIFSDKLQICTIKEINAALKKYLVDEAITISAAGPVSSIEKELNKATI
jgi:predicted Zn-dependent peptidase